MRSLLFFPLRCGSGSSATGSAAATATAQATQVRATINDERRTRPMYPSPPQAPLPLPIPRPPQHCLSRAASLLSLSALPPSFPSPSMPGCCCITVVVPTPPSAISNLAKATTQTTDADGRGRGRKDGGEPARRGPSVQNRNSWSLSIYFLSSVLIARQARAQPRDVQV